jgi:long-chain acyl-CoA synthetase
LISYLRQAGLQVGDAFAVVSGNRREFLEAYAAAAHGGWLIAPINWHLVAEEIAYVLEDSGSKALFVDARFTDLGLETLKHPSCPTLNATLLLGASDPAAAGQFEDYETALATQSTDEPADQCLGGPMFYTSGTTGKPKGVKSGLSQTGAPIETLQMIGEGLSNMLQMPTQGNTLLVGPIYHSAQWAFSFLPLIAGSSMVIRHKFDAEEMLQLIDDHQVTNVHLVPTQFIRALRLDDSIKSKFKGDSLSIAWHGAAPCPPDVKRSMIDWWGPVISEYYGSTEGSIVTTVDSNDWLNKPGTLGKPTAIMEVMVIKEDGSKAKTGESGTLYVKNLMGSDFEYHNDPEKTSEAHLEPGVFTFGDIGYLDEEGYLYMSDRKIDMIISGGVNIYPAEIEAVLINHPSVIDAAVFGIPNEEFGEEVKGAVELTEGFNADDSLAEEIMEHCRAHLAKFKVPRSIDFVETMPRHPTGKLLKRLLRDEYWKDSGRRI